NDSFGDVFAVVDKLFATGENASAINDNIKTLVFGNLSDSGSDRLGGHCRLGLNELDQSLLLRIDLCLQIASGFLDLFFRLLIVLHFLQLLVATLNIGTQLVLGLDA